MRADAIAAAQCVTRERTPSLRCKMPNAAAAEDLAAAFADVRSRRQNKETIRRPRVYEPRPGDYVVGRVEERNAEGYKVKLMGAAVPGTLGAVAFDGATKRTRPHLNIEDLVYCRVLRVPRGGGVRALVLPGRGRAGAGEASSGPRHQRPDAGAEVDAVPHVPPVPYRLLRRRRGRPWLGVLGVVSNLGRL